MRKLTILLDLDDVLNNQDELWIRTLNDRYKKAVQYSDLTSWSITKFFPNLTERQIYAPVLSGELVQQMTPTHGTQDYTWRWYSAGHNLMVVTSTSTQNIEEKTQWLYKYYRWFDEKNLIITHRKQLVRGDILVDDGLHNLMPDNELGIAPVYTKICMDRPWNRDAGALGYGIHRVRNFSEADGIVQLLSRKKV